MPDPTACRNRPDRCPGVLRPWAADDGLLVRLRLVGGLVRAESLRRLLVVSEAYGDGRIHLTGRANLQLRALPSYEGALPPEVLAAIEATGLLPSRSHELVRNVMVSPQSGLAGGRADVRPVAEALDAALLADPGLGELPGRFLFALDDGHGDLLDRTCDLGLVALDREAAQLRVGAAFGPVVPLADAAGRLVTLAREFLTARGDGPTAPWHVRELATGLVAPCPPDPRLPGPGGPLPYGAVPGGRHVRVPDGVLDRTRVDRLAAAADRLVVTPWRGVLVSTSPEVP